MHRWKWTFKFLNDQQFTALSNHYFFNLNVDHIFFEIFHLAHKKAHKLSQKLSLKSSIRLTLMHSVIDLSLQSLTNFNAPEINPSVSDAAVAAPTKRTNK